VIMAVAIVALCIASAALSIYALNMGGWPAWASVRSVANPVTLGFGAAWVGAATRLEAAPRRSPIVAWLLVLALAGLPLTMLFTLWPFRLAFLASKPALDRLADRVALRQPRGLPLRAGLFLVVGSIVDTTTGNVGLIIDPAPSGRSGFVRVSLVPGMPRGRRDGPFYNLNYDLELGGGWWYQNED
jgi:hypothetical protein